ncbi:MAG: hypothetical protein H6673_06200 [Anaerolineales bacterium]|nr:hypothetical protein [Anaerolineales bacterium]
MKISHLKQFFSINKLSILALLSLIFILTLSLQSRLTETTTSPDASENLLIAYNLAYHGSFSLDKDTTNTYAPTNYREPLPIYFLAAHIKLTPSLTSDLTPQTISQGPALATLKHHNLIWAFACLMGVAVTVLLTIKPRITASIAAAAAVYLSYQFFLVGAVDILLTEIQAATLLIGSSVTLILALRTRRPMWFILTGVLLGCLTLTKAVFLYVGIGLIGVLLITYLIKRPPYWSRRQTVQRIALIGTVTLLTLSPWLIRNYQQFDRLEVTQRGGAVLLTRAYKNQMDILGGFYTYAPSAIRPRLGNLLSFSADDLEVGGKLQHLNRSTSSSFAAADLEAERAGRPEDAISYHKKARAEYVRLLNLYTAQGANDPEYEADKAMQDEAIDLIRHDPVRHLLTTAVFMWRGMWCMNIDKSSVPTELGGLLLNGLAFLALWVMALVGLWKLNPDMMGIGLMSVGAIAFFALASHNIPRYTEPMIPNMLVALVVLAVWTGQWFTGTIIGKVQQR